MNGGWNYPTPVRFGAGRISELATTCRELNITKPLLVTDRGLAKLPIVHDALTQNEADGLKTGLFSDVQGNPIGENVEAGVTFFREHGYDGIIAFGGGSALDVGKAIGLMAHQTRPLWDFEDVADWHTRVNPSAMAPVVAVPTTSGTGSEVGRASVITHSTSHTKKIIFHAKMLPGRVICDPALTIGLPPKITAWVGLDALSHNLEALCAPGFHPMADGIAIEGVRLINNSLLRAFNDGSDIDARSEMMAASLMGATAFQKGLGAMHAMAHPIGAVLNAHHGLTNAIVMPYVLQQNHAAIAPQMTRLAAYLGLKKPSFDAVLDWVLLLRERLNIPHTLAALQMTEADAERLAPMAEADPSNGGNPVPLAAKDYHALYLRALHGALS